MTEKRFVFYEHKGADYILDTPNTSLDFIEMLGDCLEAEEIVDLLNEQHETIQQLKAEIKQLNCELKGSRMREEDLYKYLKKIKKKNKQLKKEIEELKWNLELER